MSHRQLWGGIAGLGVAAISISTALLRQPDQAASQARTDAIDATLRSFARVNDFTPGAQDQAALATTPHGDLWVTWRSARQHDGRAALRARALDADGAPRGPELELDLGRPHGEDASVIDSPPHRWACWVGYGERGSGKTIWLRRLDGTGAVQVASGEPDQLAPTAAPLAEGGVAVAWLQPVGRRLTAHVQRFDANGQAAAPAQTLGHADAIALAAGGDGNLAVAIARRDADDQADGVHLLTLDPRGQSLGDTLVAPGRATAPSLAACGDGLAIAWLAGEQAGFAVRAAVLSRSGRRDFTLATPTPGHHYNGVAVTSDARGQLAVAWNDHDLTAQSCRIMASLGDRAHLAAPITAVADGALATDSRPRAVWHGDALALAWAGDAGLGDAQGAHVTWLRADGRRARTSAARLATAWQNASRTPMPVAATRPGLAHDSGLASPHEPPSFEPSQQRPQPDISAPLTVGADFTFTGITNTGWTPPDPHVAVGPNHVIATTNGGLAFFDKTGTRTFFQTISGAGGFWGSLGATNFVFDPEVFWDPYANRFVAFACERTVSSGSGLSFFLIAYSDDADPNGTWHRYRVDVTTAGGGGDIDSPNLGIDQNAVYMTADFFTAGQKYLVAIADKTPMLSGQPLGATRNLLITGSQSFGIPVIWGTANAMYLVEHFEATSNTTLRLHAINNPLTTPTRTTFTLTVPSYARPATATAVTASITTFDARFWSCVFRDGYLWACHHHAVGGFNVARWYQIDVRTWPGSGTPTLVQSGDVAAPSVHLTFNSIGVNSRGDALMTFARSSTTERLSIARCYRLANDPLGTMRPMKLVSTSGGNLTGNRWGDYSSVAADPADPDVLWYTHEIIPTSAWSTLICRRDLRDWLTADRSTLSASAGGTVAFELEAPSANAADNYLLLGSFSGTSPGTPLGPVTLPINFDGWSGAILANLSAPLFTNFAGVLDANACATAALNVPPVPVLNGLTMHYAFASYTANWRFASNPVGITFTP